MTIEQELQKYHYGFITHFVIIDIHQFKKELKKIKNQGYAFDDEEWFNGMVGLSVPIFNLNKDDVFGTGEAVKTVSDLFKKVLLSFQ